MGMQKILIVEDDEVTSEHLKFCLAKLGYEIVATASDTLQARNKISIYQPDLILLDIGLDEEKDGFSLASYINESHAIPFIFLSSHSESDYIKKAQESKPYGYLVKPFEPNSLHTTIQMAMAKFEEDRAKSEEVQNIYQANDRLEKLFEHTQGGHATIQTFGNGYTFSHEHLELSYENKPIKLTKREQAVMQLLLAQIGHTVSFDQMISYIWEDESATFNSLRTLIWRLRAKLPKELIDNSSGQGYRIKA